MGIRRRRVTLVLECDEPAGGRANFREPGIPKTSSSPSSPQTQTRAYLSSPSSPPPKHSHCDSVRRTSRSRKIEHLRPPQNMATVPVSEVKSDHRNVTRTAAHSHIKGLGLSSDGRATPSAGGFVGQAAAREVHWTCILSYGKDTNKRRHAVWSSIS